MDPLTLFLDYAQWCYEYLLREEKEVLRNIWVIKSKEKYLFFVYFIEISIP